MFAIELCLSGTFILCLQANQSRESKRKHWISKEVTTLTAQTNQQWYLRLSVLREASLHGDMTF